MFWWRHVWFHVVRCGLVMLWSYCDVIRRFDVVSVWGCDVVVVWCCSGACFLRGGVVWCGGCRIIAAVWSPLVACDLVVYFVVVGILGTACCRGCIEG